MEGPKDKTRKNLYQMVMDHLMEQIQSRQFTFDAPICTEKKLMEEYHISRITAKRAITELEYQGILYRKRGVGSFVERDVFDKIHPKSKTSKIIPFLLPFRTTRKYVLDMVKQINTTINASDCLLSLFITENNSAREQIVLSQLLDQNIAGLLYFPCSGDMHLDLLNQFVLRSIPVIILDQAVSVPYLHNVLCDNKAGARLLTNHLISLKHKRIAYLSESGISRFPSISERFSGYLLAMREAHLPVKPAYVIQEIPGEDRHERYLHHIKQLRDSGVTAIECENDGVARTVIDCCRKLSVRVPEEVSVCGFDANDNEITSIYQNEPEMASHVGEIILEPLNRVPVEGKKVLVPVELIRNHSMAPCSVG